ncbi:MAG: histidine phosphatase family protein [Betaproteobacteria bacterium]|nr:histidine phosphatase family protein [Betaproteobacteria bacterium]
MRAVLQRWLWLPRPVRARAHALLRVVLASLWITGAAQASDLAQKLHGPHHILLIRHALAPGVGDPAHFSLQDCNTQRNLNDEGRAQAKAIGVWLKGQGLGTAQVLTSPWCRCQDTARLMDVGPVTVEPSLSSFFDQMQRAKSANQALQAMLAQRLKSKGQQALILVTHHVNIFEFMGQNIGSGDMVLAQIKPNGQVLGHQVIPSPR